jgi:CRISPR-associated protein Cmr2
MDWFDYFKAKTWALLHDPPNKMWIVLGEGRCFEKTYLNTEAHEDEGASLWYEMGLSDPFGDITSDSPTYRLVKDADALSSSMDRWLLDELLGKQSQVFRYTRLHNIFNPTLSKELVKGQDYCNVMRNAYVNEIRKTIDNVRKAIRNKDDVARAIYHVLYALYELEWINKGLPPSLADTRVPTHTVFDHNYATATVVNMLWPKDEVGGYLVEVDIPGIQRLVNSARKAGDFWAGSWLTSMLAWLTVWPLVWEYGPDIVIKPTLRLNPIYHVTLGRKLASLGVQPNEFLSRVMNFYGSVIFKAGVSVDDGMLLRNPIIPGTVTLLLPTEKSEKELRYNFARVQQCLTDWAFKGSLGDDCGDVKLILRDTPSQQHPFLQLSEKIYDNLKGTGVFNDLIQLRVNIVNLKTIHGCLLNYLKYNTLSAECMDEGVVRDVFRKKVNVIKQLVSNPDVLGKYLVFDVGLTALNMKARRLSKRRLVIGKSWFTYDSNSNTINKPIKDSLDPYSEYVFHGRDNVGYIYCSVCGNEPAILHLRSDPNNPDDYDKDTKKLLSKVGVNYGGLTVYVRPGEALGPLCLLKRALYYRFRTMYKGSMFDSTEDVAFVWYMKVYGELKVQMGDECKSFNDYLTRYVKDITILCENKPRCTLEVARNVFNDCADKILRKSTGDFLDKLVKDLRVTKGVGMLRPDPSIIHFRSYYAVIRGDADNVGKLNRGEVELENYKSFIENLMKNINDPNLYNVYNKLIINIISGLIHNKAGLVVTPTYYAALSMALMITALRDISTVNFAYYTTPVAGLIFSGGDDILALAPVEVAVSIVRDLRRNYWGDGEDGFHEIVANGGSYYIAAPRVIGFGRSFSLRFANIMDLMSEEIREVVELLEGVAKETEWNLRSKTFRKDTLIISESKTGRFAILPFSVPPGELLGALDVLNELFVLRLGGAVSGNLPEDFENYREIMGALINDCKTQLISDVWSHVIDRNIGISDRKMREDIKTNLSITTLSNNYHIDPCIKVSIEKGGLGTTNIINELIEAYGILRGYP